MNVLGEFIILCLVVQFIYANRSTRRLIYGGCGFRCVLIFYGNIFLGLEKLSLKTDKISIKIG